MALYTDGFHKHRHRNTLYSARAILSVIHELVPGIESAVDLGCGVGTWLSVLREAGVKRVCGVDGGWVNRNYLQIDPECFIEHDFNKPQVLDISETYDLAISLEVAEHLHPAYSEDFVGTLTNLSGVVLFSAAIPFQGGVGHTNERWTDYWIGLFENRGYVPFDIIRKRIYSDESIPYYYRQNTILYIKKDKVDKLNIKHLTDVHIPPEIYLLSFDRSVKSPRIKQSLHALYEGIKRRSFDLFKKKTK